MSLQKVMSSCAAIAAALRSYIRAGRCGHAEEVAERVVFPASMKGSDLLGENVAIDRGYVIH
jgi:NAD(P)-dependent dehydrogenase (short-subunit alcohol dehydrogenase family)